MHAAALYCDLPGNFQLGQAAAGNVKRDDIRLQDKPLFADHLDAGVADFYLSTHGLIQLDKQLRRMTGVDQLHAGMRGVQPDDFVQPVDGRDGRVYPAP